MKASFAASAALALAVACGPGPGSETPRFSGDCTAAPATGQLVFAPPRGQAGPAFVINVAGDTRDYDAQVNAVDENGRYGPDARGTVHLDAGGRAGTLSTPDLETPTGQTVSYTGRWRCASFTTAAPVPEPTGGPATPR